MILVCVSPCNTLHTRLTIEEKGKVFNLETDEKEEELEYLIIEEDEDEGMEEETEPTHPPTKLTVYIPYGMEGKISQGRRWEKYLSPDSTPPGRHNLWGHTPGTGAKLEVLRLGSHWPREIPSPRDRVAHEAQAEHHTRGYKIGATKVVTKSGKCRVIKPALGAAFPLWPSDNLHHQASALPGAWGVFVGGGSHPHHGPLNPSHYLAPV